MADEGKGKEGEGKEGEGKGKEELIPKARLDAEVSRRHKAEKELEDIKKAQEENSKKALEEQNKFKELYEGVAPKAKLAEELEKSVGEYFAEETEGLTDEQKALIPDGALHTKLAWVKKAKKAGVFGKQNPPNTFNNKPKNGLQPDKWYLELKEGDPKLGTLTSAQYLEWKQHNKGEASVVRGGF